MDDELAVTLLDISIHLNRPKWDIVLNFCYDHYNESHKEHWMLVFFPCLHLKHWHLTPQATTTKKKNLAKTNSRGHGTVIIRNTLNSGTHSNVYLTWSTKLRQLMALKFQFGFVFFHLFPLICESGMTIWQGFRVNLVKMRHSFITHHSQVVVFDESAHNGFVWIISDHLNKWKYHKNVCFIKMEKEKHTTLLSNSCSYFWLSSSVSLLVFSLLCLIPAHHT